MDPLGSLIDWIAIYGMVGLFAIGIAERFIPVVPSYGVLVAIGVAAASDTWSVPIAIAMTTVGSFMGGLALYLLARALGQTRSTWLLHSIGRLLGLPRLRIEKTLSSFRMRAPTLIFISQIIPTVRLIAPLVASLFIVVGYGAVLAAPEINTSALALKVLLILIATEAIVAMVCRLIACRAWRLSFLGNRL
jgi:membrane protein YqaA with SNARE-associated domain